MDKEEILKMGKMVSKEVDIRMEWDKRTRYTLLSNLIEDKVRDQRGKYGTMEARDRAELGSEYQSSKRGPSGL